MEALAKIVQGADKVLNLFISMIIIVALLFGCFSLWDTYRIYTGAGVDAELLKYKPSGASDPSLTELMALNPEVRAWLTVDDTGIDYPVLQGKTNMDYINKDVYGKYSLSGSIFSDCRNAPDFSDFYTLLYGHHMDGSMMFGNLEHFHESSFFASHENGNLYTLEKVYRLEVFACMSIDAYDGKVFDPTEQSKPEKRDEMLNYIKENALQYRDIGLCAENQIIGLSTCSDVTTNGRTVVYARMTEIAEEGGGGSHENAEVQNE